MTSATTADDAAIAPLSPAETDITKLLASIDPQQLAQLLQQKATPVTLDQALQTMNGSVIELAEDARVVIGGAEHGLWIGPKGGLTPNGTRLTNWVAFRSTKHAVATITDKREARIVNDTTQYLVTLIREDGRRFTTPTPMSAADSVNPMKMLVALDAGVPATGLSGSVASAAVTTMLMTLGYEERGQALVWRRAGWLQTPEQPSRVVIVEPYSTMTADGPVEDLFVMEEDLASDNFLGSIGASADHAERTIRAFLAVTPNRLDLAVLGLGAIGAAALGLDQRTTLTLVASPGSAKTVYLDCLSRWASAPGRGRKFSMDLSGNSISAGAIQMTIAVIGTVAFADDARFTSPAAFTKFEAIAQNAYQSRVDSKLRIDGSKRDDKYGSGQAVVIATTESAPENEHAEALNSRVVWSPLLKGDVDISDGGGVDAWLQLHAQDANRLRGAYLQWHVRQAEKEGLEAYLKRTNASTAEAMHRLGASRQTQVVAILLAGWEWFTRFLAEEANLDINTIVTPDEVDAAFKKALDGSTEVAADSNPAASILERIRTAIQGFNGHIRLAHSTDGSNRPNADLAKSMGWNLEDGHWRATGETLGLLNLENDTLLLTGEGIEWAQKKLGMQSISKGQVHQGLADLDFVLNRGGTKRPAPSWGFNRQPGAVVEPSWLVPNYEQRRPPKPSPDDKF